mmetsp:Transcript_45706/g.78953  ORF Transcript_45706/g.78953 Transcript_45706/m.78953 type:complete len:218 (-) Transcript_45706:1556-2209(-)
MFTTNLSIIIITGTGAGHEPQNKSPGPEELSSTVLWLGLNPRTEAHRIEATRMVFLQSTTRAYTARTSIRGLARSMEPMTSRKPITIRCCRVLSGGGFFLHRRTTKASSEKGMDSARRHHLHPSSRLLFGRSVSSLSASQVASLPPAGQLTKREVNRLHRRSRDEKTELNRRVPQSRYFSGRRKHCRVLGLNREPLSTSVSIVPHCQEGNMSKVFNH